MAVKLAELPKSVFFKALFYVEATKASLTGTSEAGADVFIDS